MAEHLKAARSGEPLPALREVSNRLMGIFELFAYVVEQPAPRLPAYCFSTGFIHLVHECLQKEPSDRLSIELLATQILPQLVLSTMEETCDLSSSSDADSVDGIQLTAHVSIQGYLRGIFARQQAEAIDAVALAVAEDFDSDPLTDNVDQSWISENPNQLTSSNKPLMSTVDK
ncbi:Dual specificity mitogen-activated protein kinase kinase 2 [Fasciola gigantica]|uniref:Dual specificity mitogen-activated protein kinase kinase 2 n=1 Tax=Fasciola gigantica TaxID=46835 RepID=A0A504ZCQ2_FASGI|nr:Dual specificity mitogen-activated protein kinase kinase 2 [Fasciola gigantica]